MADQSWQQQMSRIEKAYSTIFQGHDEDEDEHDVKVLHLNPEEGSKSFHGANRFPPRPRPAPLKEIDEMRYFDMTKEAQPPLPANLLSTLGQLLDKVVANRNEVVLRGNYLLSLPLTVREEDVSRLAEVVVEMRIMQTDVVTLVGDLDALQRFDQDLQDLKAAKEARRQQAAIDGYGGSSDDDDDDEEDREPIPPIAIHFCNELRGDASSSSLFIEAMLDLAEDMLYSPRGITTRADGIEPDFSVVEQLQRDMAAVPTAARAAKYVAYCERKHMKICVPFYEFAADPVRHCHMLTITGYKFAKGEFSTLLEFMCTETAPPKDPLSGETAPRVHYVHELLLDGCQLGDHELHALCTYLPVFEALHSLSLRGNGITSAGMTELATVLWEYGLPLRLLQLDQNNIGGEGAMMLSKVLSRCLFIQRISISFNPIGDVGFYYLIRATMNKFRKARGSLPRPPELPDDGEFDSDGEDSEDASNADSGTDDDDDAFTAVADDESVYSHNRPAYVSSANVLRKIAIEKDIAKNGLDERDPRYALARLILRCKAKFHAISAFYRLRSRGHNMHTIEASGCGLGPFSLTMLAHALKDNHNIARVVLNENALGHSEYERLDNKAFVQLVMESKVQVLEMRSSGLFEHNIEALCRAINLNSDACPLQSLDISGNHLGPTGANIIAAIRSFFPDQLSMGMGYKQISAFTQPSIGTHSDDGISDIGDQEHHVVDRHMRTRYGHFDDKSHKKKNNGNNGGASPGSRNRALSTSYGAVNSKRNVGHGHDTEFFDDDNDFDGDDDTFVDEQQLHEEQLQRTQQLFQDNEMSNALGMSVQEQLAMNQLDGAIGRATGGAGGVDESKQADSAAAAAAGADATR